MARVVLLAGVGGCLCAAQGTGQAPATLWPGPATATAEVRFTHVTAVRELRDGRVLVTDPRERRLVLVDWVGDARIVGRTGDGPGEYRAPGSIMPLGADSSLVMDRESGRWLLVDGDSIVETVPSFHPLPSALRQPSGAAAAADAHGHVIGLAPHPMAAVTAMTLAADSLVLLLGDRTSESIETIAALAGLGDDGLVWLDRNGTRVAVGGNPLGATDDAVLFVDGWLAVARVAPYRVDWRRPDGRWLSGPRIPTPTVRATDGEKCLAVERARLGARASCDPSVFPGWPESVPPFQRRWDRLPSLYTTPVGHVVVSRTPTDAHPEPRYDVVSRTGSRVATLTLAAGQALVGVGAESVYVVTTDDFDLQTLTRHTVDWGALASGR